MFQPDVMYSFPFMFQTIEALKKLEIYMSTMCRRIKLAWKMHFAGGKGMADQSSLGSNYSIELVVACGTLF